MHGHHESWFTQLLNQFLAGPANAALELVGRHAHDPLKPWADWMATQILVALFIMALAALVRAGLSMDKPGSLQHTFEAFYNMIKGQATDVIGHHDGPKHVVYTATVFLFILMMNLIGLIPAFESPTMFPMVPLGCAVATFLYYNYWGFKVQGPITYMKHFAGPVWWLSWFMFPLEIISHFIRPMSLTIRLFANMFAGEQVTMGFMALISVSGVVFMGLHTFVSFLQAFIFMVLTMAYVGAAVEHEEH
ncbi:MAG: F0F1 ATP synthase subunit A [Acidobacteria bacterium]|nr:F0F1 ATP synthase subunit A [Acidobacteriota bacterium]